MQYVADAWQNFTCPVITDTLPLTTVAVSVTFPPEETDVTGLPAEAYCSAVDVGFCAGRTQFSGSAGCDTVAVSDLLKVQYPYRRRRPTGNTWCWAVVRGHSHVHGSAGNLR